MRQGDRPGEESESCGPRFEAARWLAALEFGTADHAEFERWRTCDPRHALAFARVYANAESLSALRQREPDAVAQPIPAPLGRRTFLRRGAAGAALALGGSAFFASRALAWTHASTGVGEFRNVGLPDGSILALNTDTQVSWRFEDERRRIRLERGEIALELNPGAPASLSSGGTEAFLSSGRFFVQLRPHKVDLLVVRGKALLGGNARTEAVAVSAGQVAALTRSAPVVSAASDERIAQATAWQTGEIVFENERLGDAVAEYNRYLTRKIVIDDPRLADQRVGGRFVASDPTSFLQALALGMDVRVVEGGQDVRLRLRK